MASEEKLIPFYKRKLSNSINKGVLRTLIFLFYIIEICLTIEIIFELKDASRINEILIAALWILIIIPIGYWVLVRVFLWIYEGFKVK